MELPIDINELAMLLHEKADSKWPLIEEQLVQQMGDREAASHLIGRLASNEIYDVEYAEGMTGDDMEHLLSSALRKVRIVRTLKAQVDR